MVERPTPCWFPRLLPYVVGGNHRPRGSSPYVALVTEVVIAPNTPQTGKMKTLLEYGIAKDHEVDYGTYKGCKGYIMENNLEFPVVVISARYRYGHLDLEVTPVGGTGTRWVQRTNIKLISEVGFLGLVPHNEA